MSRELKPMKITSKCSLPKIRVDQVEPGEVFILRGDFFLKIYGFRHSAEDDFYNCVNLITNDIKILYDDIEVTVVASELIVEL